MIYILRLSVYVLVFRYYVNVCSCFAVSVYKCYDTSALACVQSIKPVFECACGGPSGCE